MRGRSSLAVVLVGLCLAAVFAAVWVRLTRTTPAEARAERIAAVDRTAYTLAGSELARAEALGRIERRMEVAGAVWGPAVLLILLTTGLAARMRDAVGGCVQSIWLQGYGFVLLALGAVRLMELPLSLWGHATALNYRLSVQGWASWFGDVAKSFVLEWMIGGLVVVVLMWIIRRAGKRWWLWFWGVAMGIVVAGIFISPYVIDPLFNRFTPMQQADPALVAQLEQVVARSGMTIPPERMFVMQASAKSTELNAYVTGFGASKRVVVWDTTIAHSSPEEIAFIFAHELGHYALGHVALGTALTCFALLPFFWLGDLGARLLISRYGAAWRVGSIADWGGIVVLALVLNVISVLSAPIANGYSRAIEHDADVYGQEAVHGIIADPQAVGQHSFDVLGRNSLEDPAPHPIFEWWFDTHPTIRFRAGFARAYDPWAAGEEPRYFVR
ncbi:MAG TPA: M48 family metallopeptidase [Acidobacteriaceae bacterium]|nr:M48 family metallopeptidase [Acidobacteriaceae bacterium]